MATLSPGSGVALGDTAIIQSNSGPGTFALAANGAAGILVDAKDWPGVLLAANDLSADMTRVTGSQPRVSHDLQGSGKHTVIIGTIGKSQYIDELVRQGKIDVRQIAGKWESFLLQVVPNPLPGIDDSLVICGSDKRGTIYGIYELSEQMGVSPWYWWADVPVRHRDTLFVRAEKYVQGPPAVKYRGIFINDENPAFGGWAQEKFGGPNSKAYAHVFELILRLKGNYLWPAMWGKAFNEDDPESPRLADEYGIVMGTSHHEPMLRAQKEWRTHGKGPWNYATNQEVLTDFWRTGVQRNRAYESIVTIGMRGDGDEPMVKGGDMAANVALLERIVADQRKLIAQTMNPDVTQVPQLWALYKEVLDYYERGMRVPDDVTLLWCDDNWGNLRRVPTGQERRRPGGAGIYYHFDYVGGPRSYKWINTNPLPKIWEQMSLAPQYGADRIWIVNVGDLKPMELPIEFFLRLAWNPDAITKDQIAEFTQRWAQREFGPTHAQEIADIVSKYAKHNAWRKPELLSPTTFSLTNYQEAERVLEAWQEITTRAERIYAQLPAPDKDAFYQLVLYPTKASATVVELHIATGRNHLYAKQQRASTNTCAARVRELFKLDQELSDYYNHQLAGGKWNHMMDQTRIGYTSWQDPKRNILPELIELQIPDAAALGVAIEGSDSSWPGGKEAPTLPPFDSLNQQRYPIDVFNRGGKPFEFTAVPTQPWIKLSKTTGAVDADERLWVTIDWSLAPIGNASGSVEVSRKDGEKVSIALTAVRAADITRESLGAFGGLTGPTAIAAQDATSSIEANGGRWERIPDYGRGRSGMAIFPVTTPSLVPPQPSPRLEYKVFLSQPGEVSVDLITGATLDFLPERGLRLAVSFDGEAPHIVDAYANRQQANREWGRLVSDNVRTMTSTHTVAEAGVHTLKIWMVDPGVVIEKLVVHTGDVRPSYFGPPELPAPR